MKNMEGDRIPSCEGYVGDYFYERSGINFYISSENG